VLILVRHGQSTANADGLLVGRTDAALTEFGRAQARALALAPTLAAVTVVFTSPLARATETAALAFAHVQATKDDAFVEQDYGTLDGSAMATVPREQWDAFRASHDGSLGNGESLRDVDERVHARLQAMARESSSLIHDPERHVAVVSHVSPIKSAVAWALGVSGMTAWRMRLDNASLTVVGHRASGPYLLTYNDVSAWRGSSDGER
jgi:broad specificity phosphatase PhoE